MADQNTNPQQQNPSGADPAGQQGSQQQKPQSNQQAQSTAPVIDYAKIQQMLDGTLEAKENTALKAYFKQQGLSQQEAEQAMAAFKQQKAASQPDVAKLQNDIQTAQGMVIQSQIENKALLMHDELGIDLKTVPYVMKLADLSNVVVDGAINDESLKEALNKVLEDVPQLKQQQEQNTQGFRQVGAAQQAAGREGTPASVKTVPTKRWNRFNN